MTDSLTERNVVTCFLESNRKILILRRSEKVGSYQGRWAGVSGYIESTADEQALIEISEEIGLSGDEIELVWKGEPLIVEDKEMGIRWVVHPYLFCIKDREKIKIDWEHKEFRWIEPGEINDYQTVPMLKEALQRVYKD
jgi:8-oxo-dGTP pyrophosphatase MutT (NUDIX family)